MSAETPIRTLFAGRIDRRIEEVIKVDQVDEEILRDEIDEYVLTAALRSHFTTILEAYRETPNKPHEGIGVWVSGFFGSGKSSFAKLLGLAIEDRRILGESAADRLARQADDPKLTVLLKAIAEHIPTHAVIFDVSTDRGIRSGSQTLTEIMYGQLLQSLGYAKDLDLSELEITLEERGELGRFEEAYRQRFGKEWSAEKGKVAFALSEASRVLHDLDPETYPMADSWVKAVKSRADISPGKLADRATELIRRRKPGHALLFVVDEVGQFVARDVQKMLDLQAIVQSLGIRGRGRHWLVVTSQERLGDLVSGLDDKKIELARLKDRFPLQVHLEPADISEVTSRRVLTKDAAGQALLGRIFDDHRGRLLEHTQLSAEIRLPELSRGGFVDLYPLLPYQIDLIIQIVSGLRTQGGAVKHVGGANRTIIKLAQQLLIHPAVRLADAPVGTLARLDQVYDLVEGNIGSEIRAKIADVPRRVDHPLAQGVAKVICLLQHVQSVPCTPENIARALHPSVSGDSQLVSVNEALEELEAGHQIRRGDRGYRIPTPAEDDWERQRIGISAGPGDTHRLYVETLSGAWQPPPQHTLLEAKTFKAGLAIHGREIATGDVVFQLHLADEGADFAALQTELRARSQQERTSVFWAVATSDAVDRVAGELYRSREMLTRKERETHGDDMPRLITEERVRLRRHQEDLRRLLRAACLAGRVFFRGKDRSPPDTATDVGKTASEILAQVLPEVFDRFEEAAAKPADIRRGTEALFSAESLLGLPPIFATLELLRHEQGKTLLRVDSGPLKEVLDRIGSRAEYGETASGRYLADALSQEPFGWDFDAVRLFVLALMRAGKIEATSKGQTFDDVTDGEARSVLSNNNLFRQAAFRPKRTLEHVELIKASVAFQDTFGVELRDVSSAASVASRLREEVARHEEAIGKALLTLTRGRLPGAAVLESAQGHLQAIRSGSAESAVAAFNATHRDIADALRRAGEIEQALSEPRLHDLERARRALDVAWPALQAEVDAGGELSGRAAELADLLGRETFYRDLPAIEQHATAIEREYARRFADAQQARIDAHTRALEALARVPGWHDLSDDARAEISAELRAGTQPLAKSAPLSLLRSERDASDARLRRAVRAVQVMLDGERLATVAVQPYFGAGVEDEDQLDAALSGLREECARLIGQGKKVVLS